MTRRTLISHGYEAQLFTDSRFSTTPVFHYLITKGSPRIVAWGQEPTLEAAEKAAMEYIRDLHARAVGRTG